MRLSNGKSGAHGLDNKAGCPLVIAADLRTAVATGGGPKKRALKFNNQPIGDETVYFGNEGARGRRGTGVRGEARSSWRNEDERGRGRTNKDEQGKRSGTNN